MYLIPKAYKPVSVRRLQPNAITGRLVSAPKKSLFIKGPIPLDWINRAASLPGKSLNVAFAIWWLNGMADGKPLKLTRLSLKSFCVKRDAASAALTRLESAGLIRLRRSSGQRPLISILTCSLASDDLNSTSINP